ncbi:hypothetical protein G9A89_001226 [Geosiphon pyriformis]|nr:hypothetical protein G9A89_001226 [Geosiphon pyriformis]
MGFYSKDIYYDDDTENWRTNKDGRGNIRIQQGCRKVSILIRRWGRVFHSYDLLKFDERSTVVKPAG